MIGVFIVPTGLGCAIGGHAGDATPAAKLIASVCDKLILHPNVVNASEINEMPGNSLYVEGSIIDKLLSGKLGLKEVRSNKILMAVNTPIQDVSVNVANAARSTLGTATRRLSTPVTGKTGKVRVSCWCRKQARPSTV